MRNPLLSQSQKRVKVSVCMPAYNAAPYIEDAVESVLAQDYQPFELLIADDGSTDNTYKLISQYKRHPKVRIFNNRKNLGPATTRNRLLRLAQGKYITPCDADDLMLPGNLSRLSGYLDTHSHIGLVYANVLLLNTNEDKIINAPKISGKDHQKTWDLRENAINHGGSMIRKKLMLEAGGYDETVFSVDDWSMYLKLTEITEVKYLPHEVYYVWRRTPTGITRIDTKDHVDIERIIRQALSRRLKLNQKTIYAAHS